MVSLYIKVCLTYYRHFNLNMQCYVLSVYYNQQTYTLTLRLY